MLNQQEEDHLQGKITSLDRQVLTYLSDIGLVKDVPEVHPGQRKVLARSPCFLHGGDNPNALLVFADGWVCDTAKCHRDRTFGQNLPGLIRRMVHGVTNEVMDWRSAWRYARANPDKFKELVGDAVRHGKNVSGGRELYVSYSYEELAACLEVPDPYFLARGFRASTLQRFGVGRCMRPLPDRRTDLLGWSIVPSFSTTREHLWSGRSRLDNQLYGYTARNPLWVEGGQEPKWKHSLKRGEMLFNRADASLGTGPIFICEGAPDAMRIWEAGHRRVVAVLGRKLSEDHQSLIGHMYDHHNPEKVYIAADNDEPGREFAREASELLKGGVCGLADVSVVFPPSTKDFGDATVEEICEMNL
jgi:5S rRNA maturation endonuclease (ribonuclease M5)